MGFVVVFNPVDGMIRDNAFLAGQKGAKVGSECLAIAGHFRVAAIAADVIDEVLCNVRTGSVRETGRIGKCVVRVHKSFGRPRVLIDVLLQFVQIFCLDIVATELSRRC